MKHIKLYEEFVTEGKVVITATGVPGEARAALTAQGHEVRTMGPGLYITVDAAKKDGVIEYLKGLGAEVRESLYEAFGTPLKRNDLISHSSGLKMRVSVATKNRVSGPILNQGTLEGKKLGLGDVIAVALDEVGPGRDWRKLSDSEAAEFLGEAISVEAAYIHVVTGAGQDSIQAFIDDHGLDSKKFSEYVRLNQGEKYDIRDYISGAKGTVGGVPSLRQSFIKKFKIDGRRKSTT